MNRRRNRIFNEIEIELVSMQKLASQLPFKNILFYVFRRTRACNKNGAIQLTIRWHGTVES